MSAGSCCSAFPASSVRRFECRIVGQMLVRARLVLRRQGIGISPEIRQAEHPERQGVIYGRSPRAGTPISTATRIALQVSTGPPARLADLDVGARRPDAGRGAGGVGGAADREPSGDQARRASGAAGNCLRPVAASPNADKHRHRDRPASFDRVLRWILMPALVGRTLDEARRALAERNIQNSPAIGAPSVRSRGGSSTANRRKPERR